MRKLLKSIPAWKSVARTVSDETGRSFLFHFLDGYYCWIRHGCSPVHYGPGQFYKLRPYDRRRTYTIRRGAHLMRLDPMEVRPVLTQKDLFNRHYAPFIKRDWLFAKDASADEIAAFADSHDGVFYKPVDKSRGKGMRRIDRSNFTREMAEETAGQNVLLEEFIVQHPDMVFGGHSVNTIRLTTLIDKEGNVHMLKAMLRCGIGDSLVDNFCSGGVAYPVDLATGLVEGSGIQLRYDSLSPVYVHPGTDIVMLGKAIPFWKETLDLVERAALHEPKLRFIGWDVAITPHGPELVEGNTFPGASLVDMAGIKRNVYAEIVSLI